MKNLRFLFREIPRKLRAKHLAEHANHILENHLHQLSDAELRRCSWGGSTNGVQYPPFGYYNQGHAHDYYTTHLFRNSERVDLASPNSHYSVNHCVGHGPLRADELIVVDIFPRRIEDGYWGDMTRTYLKGRASDAWCGPLEMPISWRST